VSTFRLAAIACQFVCCLYVYQDSSLPDEKKVMRDDSSTLADQSTTGILSPELKDKVAANRLKAKMKLTNTQTRGLVRDLGMTWFKALEPEFTKPYFQQVYVTSGASIPLGHTEQAPPQC